MHQQKNIARVILGQMEELSALLSSVMQLRTIERRQIEFCGFKAAFQGISRGYKGMHGTLEQG